MHGCSRRSATSCAWSRACRTARGRYPSPRGHAATPDGSWSPSSVLWDTPRTTRHYPDEEWATLLAVGEAVERAVGKGDVRLTMGGEPTFVSIDDMDGDEWNTLALGPEKRRLAGVLFRRLADRFAAGPL